MSTLATLSQQFATLKGQLESLWDDLEESSGEIPEDILERLLSARFSKESAELSHAQKCDAYVGIIKNLQHDAAYYSSRAELLNRRAKTCERIEKAIKDRLIYTINQNPNLVFKGTDGDKLTVWQNQESLKLTVPLSKRSYSNVVDSVVELSYKEMLEFIDVVQVATLNTTKVKEHLKAGNKLSFATLERGEHLRLT